MRKKINVILSVLLAILLTLGLKECWKLFDRERTDKQLIKQVVEVPDDNQGLDPNDPFNRKIDFATLKQINPDIVGWVYIPDTSIDYPILMGNNDSFYLNYDYRKYYSELGSIFSYAGSDFIKDDHVCLFGHNIFTQQMFGGLKNYYNSDYAANHSKMYIYTPDRTKECSLYSAFECRYSDEIFEVGTNTDDSDVGLKDLKATLSDRNILSIEQPQKDKSNKKATAKVDTSTASYKLFQKLKRFAKKAVEEAEVKVPLSRTIINESKKLLDEMRAASDVDTFNNYLLELIAILQRPVRTGDGTGVKRIMAGNSNDFARIILREADLIQAMEGSLNHTGRGPIVTSDFTKYGIEVYEATEKQKKQVLEHLSDRLKGKVKHVYRVIPQEQQKIFNDYLKEHQIHKVKQLWHGSRNQNWMSIIQNSLKLNPDAIITGKMFGHGIYFAPSSMKSWNYTSYRGTSWANGNSDCAFMGLYAVAYGTPYETSTWSGATDYKQEVKKAGANCLHAHAGSALMNDEIVFYNEAAVVLNYIVEFE